jgi:hypothetical protein
MSTAEEIAEFISLWSLVEEVQFTNEPDTIGWKWTSNGSYTARSAYRIQFVGTYCTFNSNAIWKAKVEGKHRFFTWLLVQHKVLTADTLQIKGIQCDPLCALCAQELETADHLCLECVYAKELWLAVQEWSENLVQVPISGVGLLDWWNTATKSHPKENRTRVIPLLTYTVWNLWKERNRRIF